MPDFKGSLIAPPDARVAIIIGRFNEFVGKGLVEGAKDALMRCGMDEENIDTIWVPGAFEIPMVARRLAFSNDYDAIVCLGAVIKGETAHFDQVASNAASGIASVASDSGIPVIFEVLATDTIEQAIARAGSKVGNKGYDGALAAIEMMNLLQALPEELDPFAELADLDQELTLVETKGPRDPEEG